MNFSQLVSAFAERNEIELSPVEGDVVDLSQPCRAVFEDGTTTVELHPHSRDHLRLEGEVTTVDPSSDEGLRTLSILLKGNLAMLPSQKGSLTLDADGKRVVLYQKVGLSETDAASLTEVMEAFLDRLDTFRRGLAAMA